MEPSFNQALDMVLSYFNSVSDFKTERDISNRQLYNLGIKDIDIDYIYEKLVTDNYIDHGTEISAGVYTTKLTVLGRDFLKKGGYSKQEQDLIEEKTQDKRIKILTERQLKQNIFNLKNWWLLLLINVILSGIVSFVINYFFKK